MLQTDTTTTIEADALQGSSRYGACQRSVAGSGRGRSPSRRVLVLSTAFPAVVQPTYGIFVKERVRALASLPNYDVQVIAPVPYFPPLRVLDRWYIWSQFPRKETIDGLQVHHPRFPMVPKLGHRFQPRLMQVSVNRLARRVAKEFDFDVIDAHFVYPSGVVAARLAAATGKPLVVTGRGEDMCRFPRVPALRRQIEFAVARASHCIAVSHEIAEAFVECGASPDRVTVIGNGVDTAKFYPLDRIEARRGLELSEQGRLIVAVGDCVENKGFHVLVDAVAELRRRGHDVHARIVGGAPRHGADFTPAIEARIRACGVADYVRLVGRRPHSELLAWYNAADLFTLFSEREGSPNVLMEALACGTPAVATSVGGIPDILRDSCLGLLVPERNVSSIVEAVFEALDRTWDRAVIRSVVEKRDWRHVALQLNSIFDRLKCR